MRRFTFLFVAVLLMVGVTAKADPGDYVVDFNGLTALPEGWEAIETTIGFSYGAGTYEIGSDYSRGGSGKSLYTYQTSYAGYIVTAPVTGDVSFYVRARATRKACGVKVYTYDGTNFTEITSAAKSYTSSNTNTSWTQVSFTLTEGSRIAFQLNNACVDDIVAEKYVDAGAIAKPTDFACTATTYNSASFSWTAGGEETAWEMVYGAPGFDKDAATPIVITENPYTLTGLSESSSYEAYIRATNGTDVSSWTSKVSFSTPAQYPAPTNFATTVYTATSASFAWTAGSTETAWQIAYDTDANFDPTSSGTKVAVNTNPFTLEGLTAETTYYASIRANYGTGYSAWTDKVSFKPSNEMDFTLNDGTTTNSYIPVYGNWVDNVNYNKSQFIIESTDLTSLVNRQITKLVFYTSKTSAETWAGNVFDIYMKATDATTVSTTLDRTGTKVFTGSLSVGADGLMEVTFDEGFDYDGQNLQIGFDMTTKGSYSNVYFYGVNGGSSMYTSNGTGNSSTFLPKVTITSVPQSATPTAKMVVTADDPFDFGWVTPETPAANKEKAFTVANTGKADLTNLSITSDNPEFVVGSYATTIAQNAEAVLVTVTMNTDEMTAGSKNATITVAADDQTPVTINVIATFANAPATMDITPSVDATVEFGTVNKETKKSFTVTNNGDLTLHITSIESSNTTDFTVSPSTLDIASGEAADFFVTFVYDENEIDVEKTANITLTATGLENKVFAVTGTRSDIWSEDFNDGSLPAGWVANNWTISTFSSYEDQTPMALLTWDAYLNWYDEVLTVEYSNDNQTTWNQIYNYKSEDDGVSSRYYHKEMSFTAPADGSYYLRFTSTYQNGVDNFNGFRLAKAKEHDAIITATNIPATGNQYVEYTATVTVKEMVGKNEELTAKFFIDGTQYGNEVVETVEANGTKTITFKFTPDAAVSGDAYFTIKNADESISLETSKVAITIEAATVVDETTATTLTDGNAASVVVNYTAKAGWNTIAMPFVMDDNFLTTIFGNGYKVYELRGYNQNQLNFNVPVMYAAGYAYIVYCETPGSSSAILQNVNIVASPKNDEYTDTESGITVKFHGSYAPKAAGEMTGLYGVTTEGKIAKGSASATMKGYRGYFEFSQPVSNVRVALPNGEVISGIKDVKTSSDSEAIYNLKGQRVNAAQKGVYIIGGKKVVK